MPCRAKPDLTFLKHRERAEAAPLLEFELPELCVEGALHTQLRAAGESLGT